MELPATDQNRKLSVYVDQVLAALGNQQSQEDKMLSTAHPNIQNLLEPLSDRELEVLQLVAIGLSNTQIAAQLIVTTGTVKTHINHIFGKLAVQSRTQAAAPAREPWSAHRLTLSTSAFTPQSTTQSILG